MVATGLFMGLRGFLTQPDLLAMLGLTTDSIPQNFLSFTQILTDMAFSFLPVLVCWSAFKKFGGSPVIGIVVGLMLVHNILPTSWDVAEGNAEPLLPAFIVGFLGSKIEQWLHDHVPNALDLIVTPFVTVLLSLCLGLFAVGPVFHSVEMALVDVVSFLFQLPFGVGGGVGGWLSALFGLQGTGMSVTGIPGMLLYLNRQLPLYILINGIAFAVAFALTYIFGMKNQDAAA